MTEASPTLRLIGAALIGVWLFAALVAVLGARRRLPPSQPGSLPDQSKVDPARSPATIAVQVLSPDVFNLSSLPIWWVDRNLRLAGANDAYARAVGHPTPASAVRDNTELAPGARALAAAARDTDRAVVGEEHVTIDSEPRLLEIIAIPLRSGEVAHIALDETRRHAAHTDEATRARTLGEILDCLTSAVAMFDPAGVLRHHNAAFAELFALDRDWLNTGPELGMVFDAMRAAGRLPEASDFLRWRAERRTWVSSEFERLHEIWSLPTGRILRVTVLSRGGNGPLMIVEDGTELAQLTAGHERLIADHAVMLDQLREGIAVFAPDGKLKLFNRRFAEIVIASPEALEASPQADILMEHLAGLLNEPERARGLRSLIIAATAGRERRTGRITSTLGYVVEYAGVPLPNGNALLIANAIDPAPTPVAV